MSSDEPRYRLIFDRVNRSEVLETVVKLLNTKFGFSEIKTHMIISSPPRVLWDSCTKADSDSVCELFDELGCSVIEESIVEHEKCPFGLSTQLYKRLTEHLLETAEADMEASLILVQCEVDRQGIPLPSMLGPFAEDVQAKFGPENLVAGVDDHNLAILLRNVGRDSVYDMVDKTNEVFRVLLGEDEPLRLGFALFPEENRNIFDLLRRAEFRCGAENLSTLLFGSGVRQGEFPAIKGPTDSLESKYRDQILDRLSDHDALPTLPSVAMQVFHVIADTESSASDVTAIIQNDPAFTAKLLKIVNSAYYGFPQKIASVQHSVVILGQKEMVNLVCSLAAAKVFTERHIEGFYNLKALWLHSLGTAGLCEMLGTKFGGDHQPVMFTAGLLHDFGKLFLIEQFHEVYEKVSLFAEDEHYPLHDAEEKILGISHEEVGKELAIAWNLPPALIDAIGHHHHPQLSGNYKNVSATVCFADALYRKLVSTALNADTVKTSSDLLCCLPEEHKGLIYDLFKAGSEEELLEKYSNEARTVIEKTQAMGHSLSV